MTLPQLLDFLADRKHDRHEIEAYGIPGRSGCHGPNCGRPRLGKEREEFQNITRQINDGGVTYSMATHRNIGSGTAVSIYPDRSKVFEGKITPLDTSKFVQENINLLSQPGHALGGWYDTSSGKIYLDVSVVTPKEDKAVELGKKYNQKAVFNLDKFQEIPTGGTGENTGYMPSIKQRIAETRSYV